METNTSLRYRVNVSQTSTGRKSWESTVEAEGMDREQVLLLSDTLVAELERRYPAVKEGK